MWTCSPFIAIQLHLHSTSTSRSRYFHSFVWIFHSLKVQKCLIFQAETATQPPFIPTVKTSTEEPIYFWLHQSWIPEIFLSSGCFTSSWRGLAHRWAKKRILCPELVSDAAVSYTLLVTWSTANSWSGLCLGFHLCLQPLLAISRLFCFLLGRVPSSK